MINLGLIVSNQSSYSPATANEQRKNHLQSRQVLNRTLTELEQLVTESIPFVSKRIDQELQARLKPLDGLMREFSDLENVVREVINQGGGPKPIVAAASAGAGAGAAGMRNVSSTATLATLQSDAGGDGVRSDNASSTIIRPTLFSQASGSGGLDSTGGGGNGAGGKKETSAVRVYYKRKPVHMGSAYQVLDSVVPSAYASDVSFEITNRPTLPREGEETCRWKPPPQGKDLPSEEEVEAFAAEFPAKYQEEVSKKRRMYLCVMMMHVCKGIRLIDALLCLH